MGRLSRLCAVRRRPLACLPLAALPVLLAGCGSSGNQNVLDPASPPERSIAHLWWVMFSAAWIGFGLIVALLFLGWWRRDRTGLPGGGGDRAATRLVVGLGVVVPVALLSTLFVWSDIFVMRSTAAPSPGSTALTVDLVGHDWWWEVRYPGTGVVTANEIHIPVGVRVDVVGTSSDVIHSFWIPELNRKVDLIPGSENRVLLEAEKPGFYRGQCSEFCGVQHAHMAVGVIAEPEAAFRSWLAHMARPARAPTAPGAAAGLKVFLGAGCASCHRIAGTGATGEVGPDLTHLSARRTLAALTLPNTADALSAWIANPQAFKPGANMPSSALSPQELRDLTAYLGSLR